MASVSRLFRCAAIAVVALLALSSGAAYATSQRTFVASTGNDGNACSLAQPCRSFAAAIAKTSPNGEVIVLDSAGYGPVTVTQSVTITSPAGVYAGISVSSGTGVTVDGTGITVTLRGLTINGQGGGYGVHFVHGSRLTIDRCDISGFATAGILQDATATTMVVRESSITGGTGVGIQTGSVTIIDRVAIMDTGNVGLEIPDGGEVAVRDSSITGSASNGIHAASFTTPTKLTLDGVTVAACLEGISAFASSASASTLIDIVRSRITQNQFEGLDSDGIDSGIALIHVTDSLISSNGAAGLLTEDGGEITASGNTIVNNGNFGFDGPNGGIFTMQNNQVRDNAPANVNGTPNPLGFN